MIRTAVLLAFVAIFAVACNFYWDGPVEVKMIDGTTINCERRIDSDFLYLYCEKKEDKLAVKIPWKLVTGLKTL